MWNCLPRAGASQFHGHAQVLLSDSHFPTLQHELEAVDCYDMSHGTMSRGYYQDLLAAHEEAGLLLREGGEGDYAFAFPSLAPWKVRTVLCLLVAGGRSLPSVGSQPCPFSAACQAAQ